VFAERLSYDDGHWYANIGYFCDDERPAYPGNGKPGVGRLLKLDLRTGKKTVLLDTKGGCLRDPVVHYDGQRILFAWRKADEPNFLLHEIRSDGSGLRQVTSGKYDDYEPAYLPDGDIVFVSTRCRRWVNCYKTQVGILYRCDPDGGNVRRISANGEHDNTPALLPDGRLLYTRWEYVDRSQVGYHHLWTMNPDGTGEMVYYGNQQHSPLFIDFRPVPGTDEILGIDSPGHGRRDHMGYVSIITPRRGPDAKASLRRVHSKSGNCMDPYPLTKDLFLVARGKQILLMDSAGKHEVVHEASELCNEPRPLRPRPREELLADRGDPEADNGVFVLSNVYQGRRMQGVSRGDIKKLLVLEILPKPVNFSGGPDLISWSGTFTLERVLGTVPVEPDGSAHFEAPANRPLFFVALDDKDLSVKRMQSFTRVMPGETLGCVGCHEHRTLTPGARRPDSPLLAVRRPPSRIQTFDGYPDVMDFNRDVQPVLDKYCVGCHNAGKPSGHVHLEGDQGAIWSISYAMLLARLQVADGRNGFGNQPPRSIGSAASPLLQKLQGGHHDVKADPKDWRTVWLWVESGAPYAGTYGALRNQGEMNRDGISNLVFKENGPVLNRRCRSCHNGQKQPRIPFPMPNRKSTRGIKRPLAVNERRIIPNDPVARFSRVVVVNLTHPESSALLKAPLAEAAGGWGSCGEVFANKEDPDYQALLTSITKSKTAIDRKPRFATPGWQPHHQYVREMKRYGILPDSLDTTQTPLDPFRTDQAHWSALWGN